jgi:hypothetical protein
MARNIDDPNIVTIVFAISDIDKAKALIKSEAEKRKSDDGRSRRVFGNVLFIS